MARVSSRLSARASLLGTSTQDPQSLAASLGTFRLMRDDSGPSRVYRDNQRFEYASVTSVLHSTADHSDMKAWMAKAGKYGADMRDVSAKRGTLAHNQGEYLLKTARKMAAHAANARGTWKQDASGLWRPPRPVTRWALRTASKNLPSVGFSARGYAQGLVEWIVQHVTAIYLIEFKVCCRVDSLGRGFAGTGDALLEIDNEGPYLMDWKTSQRSRAADIDKAKTHFPQLGAYGLGLEWMTDINISIGGVLQIKRAGPPIFVPCDNVTQARKDFLDRFHIYCTTQVTNELNS